MDGMLILYGIALGVVCIVLGWLVARFVLHYEITTLKVERDRYATAWEKVTADQQYYLASIGDLQAQVDAHMENAERYALVRYFLENDHGELAIEAFFGPQAVLDATTLDNLLDEELDQRYLAR